MKHKIFALALLAGIGLFLGCTVQGPEYVDELDVVYSVYDQKYDFQNKGTYSLPDKIVKINGKTGDEIEYIKNEYAIPTLAQIDKNMTELGWTKVTENPDVQILPAAWTTTNISISGGYWGDYWCWWDPYYCGGGWYYPYPTYSSFTTGTMVISMVDPNKTSTDDSREVVWFGAINGLFQGTYISNRINNAIDQAFTQSPYLNLK